MHIKINLGFNKLEYNDRELLDILLNYVKK